MTDTIIDILEKKKVKLSEINYFKLYGFFILVSNILLLMSFYYIFMTHSVSEPMTCIYEISQIQNYQICGNVINFNMKLYESNDTEYVRLLEKATNTNDFIEKKKKELVILSERTQEIYEKHLLGNKDLNFFDDWI